MPGEFNLIDWIRTQTGKFDHVLLGPGDDLAVLKWKSDDLLIVGVDQVLDTVHFDSSVHSPHHIGRKVMNRNLSDCAAMACLPTAAVATVALPRERDIEYAKQLFLGMKSAASIFDFPIVGGDTASWDGKLAMTVTILGRSGGIEPVRRSGAKPGDAIYVSGPLGGSTLGRHMNFMPQIDLGRFFAQVRRACHDRSKRRSLARDLRHICRESGVGAVIRAKQIPIHDDALLASFKDHRTPLEHALHDGEDYELLFASPPFEPVAVEVHGVKGPPNEFHIGEIVAGSQILLDDGNQLRPLEAQGWEHRL